jgi:hypothetical protein
MGLAIEDVCRLRSLSLQKTLGNHRTQSRRISANLMITIRYFDTKGVLSKFIREKGFSRVNRLV